MSVPFSVERVGMAKNKALGFVALFQRCRVKLSTKFRVWPVAGSDRYIELDPSQWRDKYSVIAEHRTSEPARPT